ncbi:MAG: hypothetical protein HGB37_01310 [Candidatus Moranbacteria bacterium]|nr:hypothetical protein [Candidatus Moranbacteria bacterium]
MKRTFLAALLALFISVSFSLTAAATEYFHADPKARLYNEMSSFQVMRNDLVLEKMNKRSTSYGFAIILSDRKLAPLEYEKIYCQLKTGNAGKRIGYYVIFVGPDMRASYVCSNRSAGRLAESIIERSTYNDKVLAGPLVYSTVETMKHH